MAPRSSLRSPAFVAALAGLLLFAAFPLAAPSAQAQAGPQAVAVGAGTGHTCIVLSDGNVDCYGDDSSGQSQDYSGGDAVAVDGGMRHTCALTSAGDVDCWGFNEYGQVLDRALGDAAAIAAGNHDTCILLQDGNAVCGGYDSGQIGGYSGGDAVALAAGDYHTCYLLSSGNVDCQSFNGADSRADDYLGGDAVAVAAGNYHTCIVLASGNVDCRGYDWAGETADYLGGDAVGAAAGNGFTCILKESGTAECHGWMAASGPAVALAAGQEHVCFLRADGTVDCWGFNNFGHAEDFPYPPGAPSEPRSAATAPGRIGHSIVVSWQPPLSPGGTALSNYRVYRGAEPGQEALLVTLPPWEQQYTDENLPEGSTFHYRIAAVNAGGEGNSSEGVSATSEPGPPGRVEVERVQPGDEPNSLRLSWEPPANDGGLAITEYRIKRGHGADWSAAYTALYASTEPYATVSGEARSLLESDLAPGVYAYTITAVNSAGAGPESWGSATILQSGNPTPPSEPLNLTATSGPGVGEVTLKWEPPADDGGSPVLDYSIQRTRFGPNGQEPWTVIGFSNGTTYTDTGLDGSQYEHLYAVNARNAAGEGRPSNPVRGDPLSGEPVPPSEPRDLTSRVGPSGEVSLFWAPPSSDGGSAVLGYNVYRQGPEGQNGSHVHVASAVCCAWTDHPDPAPSEDVRYTYSVTAYNEAGEGMAAATTVPGPPQPPSEPLNLTATPGPGAGEVTLSWRAPLDDGGSAVLGYNVYRYRPAVNEEYTLVATTNATNWTDSGLDGVRYYLVAAYNAAGEGSAAWVEGQPAPLGQPPSEPLNLTARSGPGVGEVTLEWQPPADDGGSPVYAYSVQRTRFGPNGQEPWTVIGHSNVTTFTDTGLDGSQYQYFYAVNARNAVGEGGPTNPVRGDPLPGGPVPPSEPRNLTAMSGPGVGEVTLEWQPPADDGGSPVLGYSVQRTRFGPDGQEPWTVIGHSNVTTFTDTGLDGSQYEYFYAVNARNAVGEGGPSFPVQGIPVEPQLQPPSEPLDLTARSGPGVGEVTLKWRFPADEGDAPVDGFSVYSTHGNGTGLVLDGTVEAKGRGAYTFRVTGLAPGEQRTFRVAAYSAAGEGAPAEATGEAFDVPSAPLGVNARLGILAAVVSWEPPADDGGQAVRSYTVYRSVGGSGPEAIATVAADQLEHRDTGCTLGQRCEYRVTALNRVGESPLSEADAAWGTALPVLNG